jgi:hypothetical protein
MTYEMTWRRKHVTASMDRDVKVLLRRRHDVVTRMLSNVAWVQSAQSRSDLDRTHAFWWVQNTPRLTPHRCRISFMCAVYTDVFYPIWMWSRSDLFFCCWRQRSTLITFACRSHRDVSPKVSDKYTFWHYAIWAEASEVIGMHRCRDLTSRCLQYIFLSYTQGDDDPQASQTSGMGCLFASRKKRK